MTAPLDPWEVRRQLRALTSDRRRADAVSANAMKATRPLVLEGHRLGIGPTELAELAGLSRTTIYDLIAAAMDAAEPTPGGDA